MSKTIETRTAEGREVRDNLCIALSMKLSCSEYNMSHIKLFSASTPNCAYSLCNCKDNQRGT